MKLTYQTGIATFIQLVVMSLLSLANSVNSIITTCVKDSSHCVENMIPSIWLFILIAIWFGFVWFLGYTAQEQRRPRRALLLIGAEGLTAMMALFNAKHRADILGLVTSLIDLALAIWIIWLAFRLLRSGGGRVVVRQRVRRRPGPGSDKL